MKLKFTTLLLIAIFISSCSSVKVMSDYDTDTNFSEYKTFAFYKKGVDKANASDLDKRRILKAIELNMQAKGLVKSSNPDILISISTKSRERVNVTNNNPNLGWGWGWGWYPWFYRDNDIDVRQYTEGTLFIDFIDVSKNELVWQGIGSGALKFSSVEKKEERIREFVTDILAQFPPKKK